MSSRNLLETLEEFGAVRSEVLRYRGDSSGKFEDPEARQVQQTLGTLAGEAVVGLAGVAIAAPNTLAQVGIMAGTATVMAIHGVLVDRHMKSQ